MPLSAAADRAAVQRSPGFGSAVAAAYDRAVRTSGPVDCDLTMAGTAVRLSFAGSALVPILLPAFDHLAGPDRVGGAGDPELVVKLWDTASTATPPPDFPWGPGDVLTQSVVRGYDSPELRVSFDPNYGGLLLYTPESRTAFFWVDRAERVAWYERAAPLRNAFHWGLSREGRRLVHAGAVATPAGGVLLAGRSGSGKSSVALACLAAGFGYVGDDYVLLSLEGAPTAHSVHATAKVREDAAARLPSLAEAFVDSVQADGAKVVVHVNRHRPQRIARSAPVRAIVAPRVAGAERTTLRRMSRAEALRALAPSTVFQLPPDGGAALGLVAELVKQVPSYALDLGPDLEEAPGAVARAAAGA